MSIKVHKTLRITIFIITLFLFSSCFNNNRQKSNGERAIIIAKQHILDKYNFEAELVNWYSILSFGNGTNHKFFYSIGFYLGDEKNNVFSVLVSNDLSYIFDSYNIVRFRSYSENYLKPKIESIWIESRVSIFISHHMFLYYIFNPPVKFKESIDLEIMKSNIDFNVVIFIQYEFDNKVKESIKMYNAIEIIKNTNFKPEYIIFVYRPDENHLSVIIKLSNWTTIRTVQEIIEIINDTLERM